MQDNADYLERAGLKMQLSLAYTDYVIIASKRDAIILYLSHRKIHYDYY